MAGAQAVAAINRLHMTATGVRDRGDVSVLVVILGSTQAKAITRFAGLAIGLTLVVITLSASGDGRVGEPRAFLRTGGVCGRRGAAQLWLFIVAPRAGAAILAPVPHQDDRSGLKRRSFVLGLGAVAMAFPAFARANGAAGRRVRHRPVTVRQKPSYPTYADRTGGDVLIGYHNWRSTMSGYRVRRDAGVGRSEKFRDLAESSPAARQGYPYNGPTQTGFRVSPGMA